MWTWLRIDRSPLDISDALYVVLALPLTISAVVGHRSVWDVVVIVSGVALVAIVALRVILHLTDRLPTRRRYPRT